MLHSVRRGLDLALVCDIGLDSQNVSPKSLQLVTCRVEGHAPPGEDADRVSSARESPACSPSDAGRPL